MRSGLGLRVRVGVRVRVRVSVRVRVGVGVRVRVRVRVRVALAVTEAAAHGYPVDLLRIPYSLAAHLGKAQVRADRVQRWQPLGAASEASATPYP